MADEERAPRRLQVANMRPDDSGRGIARLPRSVMNAMGGLMKMTSSPGT